MRQQQQTKWYNKWWVWVIAILVVILLYKGVRESTVYYNYVKVMELEREEQEMRLKAQDSLAKVKEKEIKELKLKISKINVSSRDSKIKELQQQLDELRKKKIIKDTLSPEELNIYLQKLLK